MGLRQLKKERTRQLIAETAWRLFAERGFDRVTVAEVAREAEVAEATVFNYFPAKEDLFFFRLEAFGARLVEAISTRPAGEPALAGYADSLAELLAAETGAPADDVKARVAANALMGVQRTLIDYVRRRVLADDKPGRLAADVRSLGKRALALLANGLGDYAAKPAGRRQRKGAAPSSEDG